MVWVTNVGNVRRLHALGTVCQLASPTFAAFNGKLDLFVSTIAGAISIPARFEKCWGYESRYCASAAIALEAYEGQYVSGGRRPTILPF